MWRTTTGPWVAITTATGSGPPQSAWFLEAGKKELKPPEDWASCIWQTKLNFHWWLASYRGM